MPVARIIRSTVPVPQLSRESPRLVVDEPVVADRLEIDSESFEGPRSHGGHEHIGRCHEFAIPSRAPSMWPNPSEPTER